MIVLAVSPSFAQAQTVPGVQATKMIYDSGPQIASLQSAHMLWQRTSPTPQQPDGPVLYQLLFAVSGTAGTVPAFDTNPRHLINSPITVNGGNVTIGGANGLNINGTTGILTFANGQTFPASGPPNLAGEVTGPLGNTVVSNAVSADTANAIVRRDVTGGFYAGTIRMNGFLQLSSTLSSSTGVLYIGAASFLHNFGGNTFVGQSAGNFTMTGPGGNTAVGAFALSSNTTGYSDAAFGQFALSSNTAGTNNSAFGLNALNNNTTGNLNSAFGSSALTANTTGANNSAFGVLALSSNTTAVGNSAFGVSALQDSLTGTGNAAFGFEALQVNSTGDHNSAFGYTALQYNTGTDNSAFGYAALQFNTASGNTAFGKNALQQVTTGSSNIGIGDGAGSNHTGSDSNNIDIGNAGSPGDSNIIRIGGASHTAAFLAGIFGSTSASGTQVFVNGNGQLGTTTSSRRYKDDIADLGEESDILMKLRPVAFYYKPELDATHTRQYGLVAEEVAQVAPGLVIFDSDGRPQTVRYHFVNAMLLNEVQKQRRLIEAQQKQITTQANEIETQKSKNETQEKQLSDQQLQIAHLNDAFEKQQTQVAVLQQQFHGLRAQLQRHDARLIQSTSESYRRPFEK